MESGAGIGSVGISGPTFPSSTRIRKVNFPFLRRERSLASAVRELAWLILAAELLQKVRQAAEEQLENLKPATRKKAAESQKSEKKGLDRVCWQCILLEYSSSRR